MLYSFRLVQIFKYLWRLWIYFGLSPLPDKIISVTPDVCCRRIFSIFGSLIAERCQIKIWLAFKDVIFIWHIVGGKLVYYQKYQQQTSWLFWTISTSNICSFMKQIYENKLGVNQVGMKYRSCVYLLLFLPVLFR